MRKKSWKYIILICVIIFAFCAFYCLKPKVTITREAVENNIPPKINVYSNKTYGDSVLLYLPYKFRIENNRLRRIKIGDFYYKQMNDIHSTSMKTLYFDEGGNPFSEMVSKDDRQYILDQLLADKKIIDYLQLKNIEILFPFSSKSVYYYKSYKLSTKIFQKPISKQEYVQISENFHDKQKKNLFHKEVLPLKKKIIDSLYKEDKKQSLLFSYFKKSRSLGKYEIRYDLSNDKQTFSDYYDTIKNMNKYELYEFLTILKNMKTEKELANGNFMISKENLLKQGLTKFSTSQNEFLRLGLGAKFNKVVVLSNFQFHTDSY